MTSTANRPGAAEAVNEAARTMAEASRQTIESAQAAAEYSRTYLDESTLAGHRLFSAWVAGTEALVKATFDVQNASLAAGISLIETTMASNRNVTQEWTDIARQAQKASIEVFEANVRAAEKLTLGLKPVDTPKK